MKNVEHTTCNTWNEMSYKTYNKNNRKNAYEKDVFELEKDRTDWLISVTQDSAYPFDTAMEVSNPIGLYEDLSLENCLGIEDIFDMIEEYN